MKIYKGWVIDTTDIHESGIMQVYCPSVSEDGTLEVQYTSPFAYPAAEGGLVAFPGIDQEIFIFTPDGQDDGWAGVDWYYWGSVFGKHQPDLPIFPEVSPGKSVYNPTKMKPESIVLAGPRGNQLNLSFHEHKGESILKTELKTGLDKAIQLIDNWKNDKIVIKNQHGDRILLTGEGYGVRPARSAEIRTKGYQNYESIGAGIQMMIRNGKEIDITNESNPVGGKGWADDPNNPEENDEWYGNINLSSKHRDINLIAKEGRLFINTPGKQIGKDGEEVDTFSLVQIASGSSITIWADADIGIKSKGSINMHAEKDLNILAGGNINMRAEGGEGEETGKVNIKSERLMTFESADEGVGILAKKEVKIDGSKVMLATPPEGAEEPNFESIKKLENHYKD